MIILCAYKTNGLRVRYKLTCILIPEFTYEIYKGAIHYLNLLDNVHTKIYPVFMHVTLCVFKRVQHR